MTSANRLRLAGCLVAAVLVSGLQGGKSVRNFPKDETIEFKINAEVAADKIRDEPSHTEQELMRFYIRYMPDADRKVLHYSFLYNQVKLTLQARSDNDWALDVPWEIFLNYVLPYANLDEPREDWRSSFYERFAPLVAGASSTLEAANALNYQIWTLGDWSITFKANQTPDIMSPSQVISHGYASCTGLAIFFVDACRAVGIPARVAGIAEWTGTGGNHNWVEIWHNGVWSFTDPLGNVDRPWNQTWFFPDPVRRAVPNNYAHGIYAASFQHTGKTFPLAWHDEYKSVVPAYDVTQYYLDAAAAADPSTAASQHGATYSGDVARGDDEDMSGRGSDERSEETV